MVRKEYFLVLAALISLPACGPKKKKSAPKKHRKHMKVADATHIPLADDDSLRSLFDDDIDAFVAEDDDLYAQADTQLETKNVYFAFGSKSVTPEQEAVIEEDIALLQEVAQNARDRGEDMTVLVEGHSCSSAGSATYNLALSEKRAKEIADRFEAAGLTTKIVGRGAELPAFDADGNPVTGGRDEQALNRRAEVRVLYS